MLRITGWSSVLLTAAAQAVANSAVASAGEKQLRILTSEVIRAPRSPRGAGAGIKSKPAASEFDSTAIEEFIKTACSVIDRAPNDFQRQRLDKRLQKQIYKIRLQHVRGQIASVSRQGNGVEVEIRIDDHDPWAIRFHRTFSGHIRIGSKLFEVVPALPEKACVVFSADRLECGGFFPYSFLCTSIGTVDGRGYRFEDGGGYRFNVRFRDIRPCPSEVPPRIRTEATQRGQETSPKTSDSDALEELGL